MSANPYISYNGGDGGYIDYSDPQPDQIVFHDIALSLSREARFNGLVGIEHGYSVAQHSVLVSLLVPQQYALAGLFHDAAETYLRDIPSPAKRLLPDYQRLEARVQGAVNRAFNLPASLDAAAKHAVTLADQITLATEVAYLMPKHMAKRYNCRQSPIERSLFAQCVLEPVAPAQALNLFVSRFESITQQKPFHQEPFLWAAQMYDIPLKDAALAVACLRSALSLWRAGKDDAAYELISRMAPLWQSAPMPQALRGTPLADVFTQAAAHTVVGAI